MGCDSAACLADAPFTRVVLGGDLDFACTFEFVYADGLLTLAKVETWLMVGVGVGGLLAFAGSAPSLSISPALVGNRSYEDTQRVDSDDMAIAKTTFAEFCWHQDNWPVQQMRDWIGYNKWLRNIW